MQTPHLLQEIRLVFTSSQGDHQRALLTDGDGRSIGVEQPFAPFLSDADYENLRWYLEEYMDLPDGGAASSCTPWAVWARPRSPVKRPSGRRAASSSATPRVS
jgi:hypothetical protein